MELLAVVRGLEQRQEDERKWRHAKDLGRR
jgi:hypothetical protein